MNISNFIRNIGLVFIVGLAVSCFDRTFRFAYHPYFSKDLCKISFDTKKLTLENSESIEEINFYLRIPNSKLAIKKMGNPLREIVNIESKVSRFFELNPTCRIIKEITDNCYQNIEIPCSENRILINTHGKVKNKKFEITLNNENKLSTRISIEEGILKNENN
ncbi:hypothetical protein [Leptospira adleri]|uniref:Lipoprotein n=1 Tax=Leptospira adleri TaxID=2023186 RepID=A0ABX4NZ65_9LEPT|nr:hypothetical protein [Leptospira adleri]PJZ60807.1 hypothetical protein CH376_16595 [Leptospira adleri]